ncbi:predicted protein [Arabidopsis lyrata subsp. lyrata]|uniref:alanine--tRNA ligase n=1 Tax=Arabidopsis lyrata subsp. lyrata TaxID=81972 RepID=D7KPV8_ARALL|nr:predicted protein [Arabidopsis lyrata subsp. lyrata]
MNKLPCFFMTQVYGLPTDRIYSTYFEGDVKAGLQPDNEAGDIWLKFLPSGRVMPFDCKDNFWEMGDTGPCGPCTEIHYDRDAASLVNKDDPTCLEIWNLVFIQFNNSGKVGADDVDRVGTAYRVVADPIRTLLIAIVNGSRPGSEGLQHDLRSILRGAVRYGKDILKAEEGYFNAVLYPGTRPTVIRIRFKFFLATLLHWLVSVVFEIAFNLRTELLWVICGGCFFQLMNWVVRSWIYRDPLFVNTSVSLLHSIITSASVVFILLNQCLAKGLDEMFDHSELWDMLQYRLYSGLIPSIVVHHLILLVCFTLALYRNVTINYLILTLICEMHSIFLHVRKLRRMAGIRDSNTALVKLEWVLNWTAFVFARCIPHILISVKLIKDAHKFGKGLELPMLWLNG